MMVMVAALNPTTPHGWRPYHRPDCWHLTKEGTRPGNWVQMEMGEARADLREPCRHCGPAHEQGPATG